MDVIIAITAFHTKRHAVHRRIRVGRDADDLVVLHKQIELASDTAVGAGGRDFYHLMSTLHPVIHLVGKRSSWAVCHALTARLAACLQHGRIGSGYDSFLESAQGDAPHIPHLNLSARQYTTPAQDAAIHVHPDEWIG